MPITFAHPLAVAPLARTGLPLGALVVGTVVPDLPLFARAIPGLDRLGRALADPSLPSMAAQYRFLHSPLGLFTANIIVGLLVLALWWWLLRPAYRDALPQTLRDRTRAAPTGALAWLLAIPALVIGSSTHIVWDQFTHRPTWVSERLGFLQAMVAGFPVTILLQYSMGLLGIIGVLLWLSARISRRDEHAVPQDLADLAPWMFAVPVVAGLVAVVLVLDRSMSAGAQPSPQQFAFDGLTTSVAAALCAAVGMAVVHRLMHLRVRRARR